jgi:transposase
MARKRKSIQNLPVIQPDAAGADVGVTQVFVAVPADRDPEPARYFDTFTPDLEALADWLASCGIRTVVMESTAVYWIPLFQILQKRGIEARLVNARHVKNVPGRKRDGADLAQVPGINSLTAQMLLTEIGPDLSAFPNVAAFASWLRLCPDKRVSGGKVLSSRTGPTKNRAALALRMAAQSLHRSETFLGEHFRRMRARLGAPKAITAPAHKRKEATTHERPSIALFRSSPFALCYGRELRTSSPREEPACPRHSR